MTDFEAKLAVIDRVRLQDVLAREDADAAWAVIVNMTEDEIQRAGWSIYHVANRLIIEKLYVAQYIDAADVALQALARVSPLFFEIVSWYRKNGVRPHHVSVQSWRQPSSERGS